MKFTPRMLAAAAWLAAPILACDAPEENDDDTSVDPSGGIVVPDDDGDDDGDGSTGDDDGLDDTGDTEPFYCVEDELTVDVSLPHVVLVLDKSGSMVAESWNHDGIAATPEVTRWHSLHDVTMDLVESLENDIAFGAVLFPSAALTETLEATACTVEPEPDVSVGLSRASDIRAALPAANELEIHGATPTRAGITTALEHLRGLPSSEPRAIVLVTDGAANCNADGNVFGVYDEDLAPLVAEAAAEGIPTYVVGIDIVDQYIGSSVGNPHERMSEVALAGGVPREGAEPYYVARDEHALREAIDDIAGRIQCRLELPLLPEDPDLVHLLLDDVEVPHVDSCEDGTGWRYTEDGAVELCDATCDAYGLSGAIQTRFDCEPEK